MTGQITPINLISSINGAKSVTKPDQVGKSTGDFGELLSKALNTVAQSENKADNAIAQLAAGEEIELHQVMLAMQEADITFQIAVQMRNKLVEAYQDIMRMQV